MRVFAATKNAGKLRELQELFAQHGWSVHAYDGYVDPPESESTYRGNAALKARALAAALRASGSSAPVVADDSGLEVAALGGRPGVRSARYGSPTASWAQRREALLHEVALAGSGDRAARFVCALHYIAGDGRTVSVEEAVEGRLAERERGAEGFSYDALFLYPALDRTFGELTSPEKNAISHRARAVAALVAALAERADSGM